MKGVKQHDIRDCRAACLATICQYHGLKIPLVKVREAAKVDKNGSSLYAIVPTAAHFNLVANARYLCMVIAGGYVLVSISKPLFLLTLAIVVR